MTKITNQELYYNILLKKYNILKKNLIIIEQTKEKTEEFKNTIIEIDKIEQEKFKKELEIKKELTTNLKDEYNRLFDYVNLLEDRNNKRVTMLEDYNNIVKENIDDLEEIEDYDNIEFYVKRLEDISEYLNNDEKYNKFIEEKTEYLKIKDEYQNKVDNLNKVLEDYELNLLIKLKNSINNNKLYENLDFDNLEDSITEYEEKLKEKERELNTYLNSYKALINVDLVESEKEDYLSFVDEEKKEFVNLLEKKYILLFYKYINENEFEKVLQIYNERIEKLTKYDLEDCFDLNEVLDIINNYVSKKEYLNELILTIESIENNLAEVDNKIDILKQELNSPNIVSLLKEFCIEKEYISVDEEEIILESDEELDVVEKDTGINDLFVIEDNNEEIEISEKDEELDETVLEPEEEIAIEEKKENEDASTEILIDNSQNNLDEELVLNFGENIFEPEKEESKEEIVEELIETNIDQEKVINEDDIQEINIEEVINLEEQKDDNNIENELEENKTEEFITVDELKIVKENAITEVKDINEFLLIDEIRNKALKIMRSVCESIA